MRLGKTVKELLADPNLTSSDITEYIAYFEMLRKRESGEDPEIFAEQLKAAFSHLPRKDS